MKNVSDTSQTEAQRDTGDTPAPSAARAEPHRTAAKAKRGSKEHSEAMVKLSGDLVDAINKLILESPAHIEQSIPMLVVAVAEILTAYAMKGTPNCDIAEYLAETALFYMDNRDEHDAQKNAQAPSAGVAS